MRWTEDEYQQFLARQQAAELPQRDASRSGEPEKAFMWRVIRLAEAQGWTYFHVHRSERSPAGFPDLVLCRETVLYVEVKTNTGKLTLAQLQWLSLLDHAGQETHVWRPKDWAEIEVRLKRDAGLS